LPEDTLQIAIRNEKAAKESVPCSEDVQEEQEEGFVTCVTKRKHGDLK